jgi:hypothetical protein
MSETLFKFLLSELDTVRVRCMACNRVAEVHVDDLAAFPDGNCRFCAAPLLPPVSSGQGALYALLTMIQKFKLRAKQVEVEFVLPAR